MPVVGHALTLARQAGEPQLQSAGSRVHRALEARQELGSIERGGTQGTIHEKQGRTLGAVATRAMAPVVKLGMLTSPSPVHHADRTGVFGSRSGAAVLLLATASCASAPPVTISTEHGIVRASTRAQAERVADGLTLAPRVRAMLEATRIKPPELWVVDRDLSGARGVCYERRIELTPAGAAEPYYVAHELVHWYVPGSPYDGMPHFVEEGLADFVALDVLGLVSARERENDAIGELTVPLAALHADKRSWFELPFETRKESTRLGFVVVSRLGLERVRTLAAQHAGPWRYLDEARVHPR